MMNGGAMNVAYATEVISTQQNWVANVEWEAARSKTFSPFVNSCQKIEDGRSARWTDWTSTCEAKMEQREEEQVKDERIDGEEIN
ncbi:hypothetical protein niasHT_002653 [Heterodera trifolii]|uniref:Uncharacterized protein n=1 Tax=Heterodera trifolii TaxID=157864 RepID=A0ABD2LUB8_9BILA